MDAGSARFPFRLTVARFAKSRAPGSTCWPGRKATKARRWELASTAGHRTTASSPSCREGGARDQLGTAGYQQDREGIGIYALADGTGYIVSVDQLPRESIFHVYKREGEAGRPHDHQTTVRTFHVGADSTDGLDVTSASLGPEFPGGLLVAMNSRSRNFLLVRWADIAKARMPALRTEGPTAVMSQ